MLWLYLAICASAAVAPYIKMGYDWVKEKIKENYEVSIQTTNGPFFRAIKWYLKGHNLPIYNHGISIYPLNPDHCLFRIINKIFIPKNKFKLKTKYGTIYIKPLIEGSTEIYGFVLSQKKKYEKRFKNIIAEIHTISELDNPYEEIDLTEAEIINDNIEWKLEEEEAKLFKIILNLTSRDIEAILQKFLNLGIRMDIEAILKEFLKRGWNGNGFNVTGSSTLLLTDS